jgi:hypothetical protein
MDPFLFFNLDQDKLYQAELKNLEYDGQSIYKTIEDGKTG